MESSEESLQKSPEAIRVSGLLGKLLSVEKSMELNIERTDQLKDRLQEMDDRNRETLVRQEVLEAEEEQSPRIEEKKITE